MKRTITVLLLCTALCVTVFAQTGDDFEITQNKSGAITITKYTGKIKEVVIPATIEGVKVTEIGGDCFANNKNITSVIIPDSVTSIEANYIFNAAFENCTSLISVKIPASVKTIAGGAFKGCTGLPNITIPSGTKLEDASWNGVEYKGVFSKCTSLTNVTIGNGAIIGSYAFSYCTSLTEVTIPNSVNRIVEGVFSGCSSLTNITIPNSVTNIGMMAFALCDKLTKVTFAPNSKVTSIGREAFSGCSSLTNITIPNSVTNIGMEAFYKCPITSITIPDSVTSIDGSAFYECPIIIITIGANKNYASVFPNNFATYYESQGKKAATYIWSGRLWRIGTAAEAAQFLKDALEAYTFLEGWAVMPEGEFSIQTANAPQGFDRGFWDLNQTPPIRQGAKLDMWANIGEDDHYYHFISLGDGWYKIAFRQNGLVLDVIDGQNSNGVEIQAYRDNGAESQRFRFRQTKNGLYKIYTYWGRTIHTQRSDAQDGVVHTWEDLPDNSPNKKNQLWRLVKP